MKKRIFSIIERSDGSNALSSLYDILMIFTIVLSIVPLLFKNELYIFQILNLLTVSIFIVDYCLRWLTADIKLNKGITSYFIYPFTFMAIIDLLSILPSISLLNNSFKILRVFRLIRAFRVMRVLKIARYSRNIEIIVNVFKKQKVTFMTVGVLCIGYIFITALIIFNVEPETFNSFFDALYWATISLTTVGYGDVFATTTLGRIVTMISSLFGIAIVALPAGVITAGYMHELNSK